MYIVTPRVVEYLGHDGKKYRRLLIVAGAMYFVSWFLPSPHISGEDTSFTTHVIGGGVFTGIVWCYLMQSMRYKAHWLLELFSLFALVSALGAMNELFETVLYVLGVMESIADTSWDIVANTLGALVLYIVYRCKVK